MIRTTVTIDGKTYGLSQGADVAGLKQSTTEASRAGGGMVEFVVVGNRQVSALVSPGVPVIFEDHDVPDDDRDTGDVQEPWDDIEYLD